MNCLHLESYFRTNLHFKSIFIARFFYFLAFFFYFPFFFFYCDSLSSLFCFFVFVVIGGPDPESCFAIVLTGSEHPIGGDENIIKELHTDANAIFVTLYNGPNTDFFDKGSKYHQSKYYLVVGTSIPSDNKPVPHPHHVAISANYQPHIHNHPIRQVLVDLIVNTLKRRLRKLIWLYRHRICLRRQHKHVVLSIYYTSTLYICSETAS
mmetsp:Transcript_3987/g.7154  ORF Transcript_3987/g.7154 Transcript_3987/m.7154 type:complete len:208 (-) Transcript_3987:111-734(-)